MGNALVSTDPDVREAIARARKVVAAHWPDISGRCSGCGKRRCPKRRAALATIRVKGMPSEALAKTLEAMETQKGAG